MLCGDGIASGKFSLPERLPRDRVCKHRRPELPRAMRTVEVASHYFIVWWGCLLHSYGLPGMLPQGRLPWRNAGNTMDMTEGNAGPERRHLRERLRSR